MVLGKVVFQLDVELDQAVHSDSDASSFNHHDLEVLVSTPTALEV